MTTYKKLRDLVIGKPLDPLSASTRQHIALAAFIAWVGLGADGLSSDELVELAEEVQKEFTNCVFFTSKLVFRNEN